MIHTLDNTHVIAHATNFAPRVISFTEREQFFHDELDIYPHETEPSYPAYKRFLDIMEHNIPDTSVTIHPYFLFNGLPTAYKGEYSDIKAYFAISATDI